MKYETTIGLEIHAELNTKTKMFCNSLNDSDETHPNVNVCPVCVGHPGTLPTINHSAIDKLISVGLALNCQIAKFSKFDRKSYFYPDLPKGYQISQFDLPVCEGGYIEITPDRRIHLERIHMEEDAGKITHTGDSSLVDYNRAGVPLMELVTKPEIKTPEEVELFARELQLTLRYLGASDANIEKGQMRVEVNLSLAPEGAKELGTKVEVKNIGSINSAMRAAAYEIKRQTKALDEGEKIHQETRGWDDVNDKTFVQRSKEGSADYRYFPEPDLPPMRFSDEMVEKIRVTLPELPAQRRKRFYQQYGLSDSQVALFTTARHLGNYFEQTISELDSWDNLDHLEKPGSEHKHKLHTLAANYIITEFPPLFKMKGMEIDKLEGLNVTQSSFADLIVRIFHNELSSSAAKIVLKTMAETGEKPDNIIKSKDLGQVSDSSELEGVVDKVIEKNPKPVQDYKDGKEASLMFLVGQVMAGTKEKANPQMVKEIFINKLK